MKRLAVVTMILVNSSFSFASMGIKKITQNLTPINISDVEMQNSSEDIFLDCELQDGKRLTTTSNIVVVDNTILAKTLYGAYEGKKGQYLIYSYGSGANQKFQIVGKLVAGEFRKAGISIMQADGVIIQESLCK